MDALTQVVHRCQMLFPQGVQRLQHDAFFKVTHHFSANHFFLALIGFNGALQNTLAQRFFMQLRLFIQPLFERQIEVEIIFQTLLQAFDIPHLFQRLRRNMGIDGRFKYVFTNAVNRLAHVGHVEQLISLGVNSASLIVSHIVIFQQLLTDIEVAALDFTLRVGDRFGHPWMFDSLTRLHTQFTHHAGHAVRSEDTHQSIFHRQIETGRTGVPLTA